MGTDRIRPTLFIPTRGIVRRNTDESYQLTVKVAEMKNCTMEIWRKE